MIDHSASRHIAVSHQAIFSVSTIKPPTRPHHLWGRKRISVLWSEMQAGSPVVYRAISTPGMIIEAAGFVSTVSYFAGMNLAPVIGATISAGSLVFTVVGIQIGAGSTDEESAVMCQSRRKIAVPRSSRRGWPGTLPDQRCLQAHLTKRAQSSALRTLPMALRGRASVNTTLRGIL